MKNKYVKPTLAVDLFCPAQSIARDCADNLPRGQVNFADINACAWDLGGGTTIFVGSVTCTMDGEGMGFACYNNPSESNYIFRS